MLGGTRGAGLRAGTYAPVEGEGRGGEGHTILGECMYMYADG